MKIVFFTDTYRPSIEGVTASIDLFADSLRTKGHRVWIVAPAPAKPLFDEHPDIIRLPSIPSVWYQGAEWRDSILTPNYAKLIRELKPDLFHFHTLGMTGLAGMRLMHDMKMPSVAQYHTDIEQYAKVYRGLWVGMVLGNLIGPLIINKPDDWPDTLSGMKPKRNLKQWNESMIRNLIRYTYDSFDQIIAPSEKMRDYLEGYGVSRPIAVIPTGINPDEFSARPMNPPVKDHGPFRLLYVGRVTREKNVSLLILMMAELKKISSHPVHLTIIGPGTYLTSLSRLAREQRVDHLISFKGGQPRQAALLSYTQADAFVFPSETDTQALVLNEAAYCGLPLLFSDPDISRIAQADRTGLLIPADAHSYAQAVLQLIQHKSLRQQLGQAAKKRALHYTSTAQAIKLERVYRKALSI